MTAQRLDRPLAFLDAALVVALPEHRLGARLVQQIDECELDRSRLRSPLASFGATSPLIRTLQPRAWPVQSVDRPAGENLREFLHVLLCVAAVDAERVELEQLARVVLVQSAALTVVALTRAGAAGGGSDRLKVVEIDEHRRMLRRGEHHVLEASEHVRPDHLSLVAAGQRSDDDLRAGRDAQVIGPERDESLDERPLGGDACGKRGVHLRLAHLDDVPARLAALLVIALAGHSDGAQCVTDGRCGYAVGRCQRRRSTVELRAQPLPAHHRSSAVLHDERRARID